MSWQNGHENQKFWLALMVFFFQQYLKKKNSKHLFIYVIYLTFEIKPVSFIMYTTEVQTADRIYCRLLNIEKMTYYRYPNAFKEENRYCFQRLS